MKKNPCIVGLVAGKVNVLGDPNKPALRNILTKVLCTSIYGHFKVHTCSSSRNKNAV